jgi:hypothetical protein
MRTPGLRLPRAGLAVVLVLGFLHIGCGKAPLPAPVAVKGRVELAGNKPPPRLVVIFHPREEHIRNVPSAAVDGKGGEFSTFCEPGRYHVTVAPVPIGSAVGTTGSDPTPGRAPTGGKLEGIPSRYRDPENTPWEVLVPPAGMDNLVLTVK